MKFYQLIARGPTECFGIETLRSTCIFKTREKAQEYEERFLEKCTDSKKLICLDKNHVEIKIIELEVIE